VLADGGLNREAWRVTDYGQHARSSPRSLPSGRPCGTAWERFTSEGPLALLPSGPSRLVWSAGPAKFEELRGLPDREFLARLRQAFGGKLGSSVRRASLEFPPILRSRRRPARASRPRDRQRAQTLHPVAGQGLQSRTARCMELARMLLDVAKEEIGAPPFSRASPAAAVSIATRESASPIFWSGCSRFGAALALGAVPPRDAR